MSKPVVEVSNLSKLYIIRRKNKPDSLRELLSSNPLRGREPRTHVEEFWALKDINFDLREGETMAIIGRNGAGKSTLLKILSHIVTPTTGKAIIRGKTASLLEVGIGFHPELTGRENVYFNGALLGMSNAEISRKFREIVEFSEIGDFIDSPVKHYSSGMRGRLGFSVAAHLDADIMIIDEVLSTGDVGFRKKALEKMKAAAFDGRSVLFVTHSMGSAEDLCQRAIYLEQGKQIMMGDTKEVIEAYVGSFEEEAKTSWKANSKTKVTDERIVPVAMKILANGRGADKFSVALTDKLEVELEVDIPTPTKAISIGISLMDEQGRRLFRSSHTDMPESRRLDLKKGINKFIVNIPLEILKSGDYIVAMDCDIYKDAWAVPPNTTEARVGFTLTEDLELAPAWDPRREGLTKPRLEWRVG